MGVDPEKNVWLALEVVREEGEAAGPRMRGAAMLSASSETIVYHHRGATAATDGAGAGGKVVFGAILGTGCGGGYVVNGRLVDGGNGIAGEWGHTPLPWLTDQDHAPPCWCGRKHCLEMYISGTGFEADYQGSTGRQRSAALIIEDARQGERWAVAALDRYVDRLGRALAMIADIMDPDVIVLGGGMSNVDELYGRVPDAVRQYVFSDVWETRVVKSAHGDSTGVRGAAWLWPPPPAG
jgi:fructokinase